MFNPANDMGAICFNEFFAKKHRITKVLEWWLSPENRCRTTKAEVTEWITEYAAAKMSNEARAVTKSKKLQTMSKTINLQVVQEFDYDKIHAMLEELSFAPFSMQLLDTFTTCQHVEKHTQNRRQRTKMVCLCYCIIPLIS